MLNAFGEREPHAFGSGGSSSRSSSHPAPMPLPRFTRCAMNPPLIVAEPSPQDDRALQDQIHLPLTQYEPPSTGGGDRWPMHPVCSIGSPPGLKPRFRMFNRAPPRR
jgi:hypothetical protein